VGYTAIHHVEKDSKFVVDVEVKIDYSILSPSIGEVSTPSM